jgi:DNA-binding response OmpR family regulator
MVSSRRPAKGRDPVRILVVDDEPAVVALLKEFLGGRGHAVTGLCSGRAVVGDAHALAQGHDVAVVDWHMPGFGGRDVVAALREARPGLPVLVATGDVAAPVRGHPGLAVLAKPFKLRELLARLSALVENAVGVEHRPGVREA